MDAGVFCRQEPGDMRDPECGIGVVATPRSQRRQEKRRKVEAKPVGGRCGKPRFTMVKALGVETPSGQGKSPKP